MKHLFVLLLFFSNNGFSQNSNLDFGFINGKNITECVDSIDGKICNSKNQFEVYLTDAMLLIGRYNTVVLSNNGIAWTAIRYEGDWLHNRVDTFVLKSLLGFDAIFSALKDNNLFTLPNQNELNDVKGSTDDGNEYTLIFKADNKFREYQFNNPGIYQKFNRSIPQFSNYVKIVEILFEWLKKE